MMTVFIIEDEIPAQEMLKRLLQTHYPDFHLAGIVASITGAAQWLRKNQADIIFMDVELSDGSCFELFHLVEIQSHVIITTAYEHYALNAFKANCVDYLLKPVEAEEFVQAVERCLKRSVVPVLDKSEIEKMLAGPRLYKQRFTVKLGDQIIIVNVPDIAYFFSEEKTTYIMTHTQKRYISDLSLDAIEEQLDPAHFFRLSRNCLASISAIRSISKHFNSRLKVALAPGFDTVVLVSRPRVAPFLEWLEGTVR